MKQQSKLLGGILLVAGTTIGAGMLALPVCTGAAGFMPSVFMLISYWLYMTFTAFLLLEVTLWMKPHANLITMASFTLGRAGRILSWILYLFLLYALTTAYIAGSSPFIVASINLVFDILVPAWVGTIPLLAIFGFFVYRGLRAVDYANRLLMIGLIITYILLIIFLTPSVKIQLLSHVDWKMLALGTSIVATSFGFHVIIPSLTVYLDQDINLLKKVIGLGSAIPLFIYLIWEAIALGIIPLDGVNGILNGYRQGANGAYLLASTLNNPSITLIATLFSFCAIITSFLGVSLSLKDFLADGLKIDKNGKGNLLLYLLTFLPPVLINFIKPAIFLKALEYAGVFGVVVLLGLFPTLMVWRGRYHQHLSSRFTVPGGKLSLMLSLAFSLLLIMIELLNKIY